MLFILFLVFASPTVAGAAEGDLPAAPMTSGSDAAKKFFQDKSRETPKSAPGAAQTPPTLVWPAGTSGVESREPTDLQPWAVDCPPGYDNGTYKGRSHCLKCPEGSAFRSSTGACLGCPAGYIADYDRPGERCFRCPPDYEAGYRKRPGTHIGENACVKCPPGYVIDWRQGEVTCTRP